VSDTLQPKVGRKFGTGQETVLPLHRQNETTTFTLTKKKEEEINN
jgi:hypothetical protein